MARKQAWQSAAPTKDHVFQAVSSGLSSSTHRSVREVLFEEHLGDHGLQLRVRLYLRHERLLHRRVVDVQLRSIESSNQ